MEGTRQLEPAGLEQGAPAPQSARLGLAVLFCWAMLAGVQIVTPLWYPTPDACSYLSIAQPGQRRDADEPRQP